MGNAQRKEDKRQVLINKRIEENLHKQYRFDGFGRVVRFLVLGCKESGKATLLNQLRATYGPGWTNKEKEQCVTPVRQAVHLALQRLQTQAKRRHRNNMSKEIQKTADFVQELVQNQDIEADDCKFEEGKESGGRGGGGEDFVEILESERIQKLLEDEVEFLWPNDLYYLENFGRICARDYVPTEADLVRLNVQEGGMKVCDVDYHGYGAHYQFLDPGGAIGGCFCCKHSLPRNWLRHFDREVAAVIYCVDLCSYRKVKIDPAIFYLCLSEELPHDLIDLVIEYASPKQNNLLMEQMMQWHDICKDNPWLRQIMPILFLTNHEKFLKTDSVRDFRQFIPELANSKLGSPPEDELNYHMVSERFQEVSFGMDVYVHAVELTDQKNALQVINDVINSVVQSTLQYAG